MISADLLRRIARLERDSERARKAFIPGTSLPYAPRVLNPFPLASSGGVSGDFPQVTAITILEFSVAAYVNTTNNGSNYWTIDLIDVPGTTLASVSTIAGSPNASIQLTDTSITQPGSTNALLAVRLTATGAPGAIYVVPLVIAA